MLQPSIQNCHGGELPHTIWAWRPDRRPHYQIISGGRGHVFAWDGTQLAASTNASGSTATKLKALRDVEVWQDGSDGCTVLFSPDLLDQVADLLKLRRRRQVTDEERKRLSELGRRYHYRRHGFRSDLNDAVCVPEPQPDPEYQLA